MSSHFSEDVMRQCKINNISFICLPPSSTHLCQPLDVAYFGPMKSKWKKNLTQFKTSQSKSCQNVPKEKFPKLLRQLLEELDTSTENLKSGFRKCGIYPFDPSPVLSRLPDERAQNDINTSVSDAFQNELKRLRHGDERNGPLKRQRRTRLNVVPGKSVTGQASNDENLPGPSTAQNTILEDELPYASEDESPENEMLELSENDECPSIG